VEELYDVQNNTGTISANNLFSFVPQVFTSGLPVLGYQQGTTCNNCTKEAYNIIISNVPQIITSSDNSSISNQCGASFIGLPTFYQLLAPVVDSFYTDGKTPSGISQTAAGSSLPNTSSSSSKNGVLRSLSPWDGLTILTGLGSLFAVLL
jgi:hypothetical protein